MYVREILRRKGGDIVTVTPTEALEFAAAKMKLEGVGALVVCGADRKLKGVIAERDVIRAIVDHGPRALRMTVADFMHAHPLTCKPGDTVASVARRMTSERVRHAPVCEAGSIAGVVSIGDIVKERFEELELERETLKDLAAMHQVAG